MLRVAKLRALGCKAWGGGVGGGGGEGWGLRAWDYLWAGNPRNPQYLVKRDRILKTTVRRIAKGLALNAKADSRLIVGILERRCRGWHCGLDWEWGAGSMFYCNFGTKRYVVEY